MNLYVKKNPNPQTLIEKVYSVTQPDGYEIATEQTVSDWVHGQILAGWEPTFPDLPIEDQKAIVEQQRNIYREQSLYLKLQVNTLMTDKETLTNRVATLTDELVELTEQLAEADSYNASLLSRVDTLSVSVSELQETVSSLEALKATIWDVRKIDPSAWYARLTMENVLGIAKLAADDDIAKSFVVALDESRALRIADPTYLMSLDHPNAIQGTAYLMSKGALSEADVTRLRADSRKDEQ